ncbi:hypothetical protein O6H91_17G011000 [Diphasiastrum complanatum]|uniref:Uncharacterized protein n=1 Tax=Diphasiastrum complanatum TaxID=34168 RepID=A0ACC2B454_DIPCM|nr:hypothetical protein O6H91_17G011000 [Diphasiastrum complanatum]
MAVELYLWIFSFFAVAGSIGIVIFQLLCLSDLEFDYINPFDSSNRINKFVLPEFAIQGILSGIYLLSGHWFMFLLNLPLLCFHARLYLKQQHLIDVTEIFNLLDREKKQRFIKLGFYLLLLIIVMYRMLMAALL